MPSPDTQIARVRASAVLSFLLMATGPTLDAQATHPALLQSRGSVAGTRPTTPLAPPTPDDRTRAFRTGALIGAGVGVALVSMDCSGDSCHGPVFVGIFGIPALTVIGGGIAVMIDAASTPKPLTPRPRPPRLHLGARIPL